MDGESSEMDSLFDGMDFVLPSEDDSAFAVLDGNHEETNHLEEKAVSLEGSTLQANHIKPVTLSSAPVISPALDPTSSLSAPAHGLSVKSATTAIPSLIPTRQLSEPHSPAPVSPSSHAGLHRDQSEPLDESLFSGLTLSSVDDESAIELLLAETPDSQNNTAPKVKTSLASIQHEKSRSFDERSGGERIGIDDKDRESKDNIMAGYSEVSPFLSSLKSPSSGTPPISRTSSSVSATAKPSIRRKKRSMKIGYGREEEENEELALRKATIREIIGVPIARKDSGGASSTSTPRNGLSRESSQGVLYVDESVSGRSFPGDREASNGVELVTEMSALASNDSSTGYTVSGTQIAATREIAEEGSSHVTSHPDGSPASSIADRIGLSSSPHEQSHISVAEGTHSEVEVAGALSSTGLEISASIIGSEFASSKDDQVGEETGENHDEAQFDIEYLAQQRERSIEERLDHVKELVAHKMEVLHRKSSAVSALRKAAVQKRRQAADRVSAAASLYKELEADLDAACEREDFEKADALSGNIAELEEKMAQAAEALKVAESETDSTASEVQKVLNLQMDIEEKGARLLESLKQEAEDAAQRVLKEAQETAKLETERLVAEEKTMEFNKENLALQFKVNEEASGDLKKAVDDLNKSENEEKNALIEKRSHLDLELQELIALVRTKEAEIHDCDKRIMALDEKMSSVVATFEKQQRDLDAELANLIASERQLEEACKLLSVGKQGVEQLLAGAELERLRLEKVARLAVEAGKAMREAVDRKKGIAVSNMLSREKRTELAWKEQQAQAEAKVLRQDASSTRLLLQELTSVKVKLSQELAAVKERIIFVEKRGPELDTEKKLAAAARNFKVAGRLAAEAKVLAAEKEAASADMTRIIAELERLEGEAEAKLSAMADLDKFLTFKEKQAAMARCERLRLVADAARDERDAAVELEDFEEAESLDSEAKTADAEAEELQKLYKLEGREYESLSNLKSGDGNSKEREAAMANCESLRLVAMSARGERDAAVEIDQFEEAEMLDSKAETADAEADRLQRLYQLEGKQFESQNKMTACEDTDSKAREAASANCQRLRLVAAAARVERDAAVEQDRFEEAEILEAKAEAADAEADRLQRLYHLEGRQFDNQGDSNMENVSALSSE